MNLKVVKSDIHNELKKKKRIDENVRNLINRDEKTNL